MNDLLVMFNIAVSVMGLGLIVTFSPALYAIELATLTHAKRPTAQTLIPILSILTPLVLLILLFILLINPLHQTPIEDFVMHHLATASYLWLKIAGGIVLCVASVIGLLVLRHKPIKKLAPKTHILNKKAAIFWFGLMKTFISASGLVALFIAVKIIKQSTGVPIVQSLLVLLLLIAAMLPFITFLLIHIHLPEKFQHIQRVSRKVTSLDYRKVMSVLLLSIGVILLLSALKEVIFS